MDGYAIRIMRRTVIWIGVDWANDSRLTREFASERKSRKDAMIYANALCRSGTACLVGIDPIGR